MSPFCLPRRLARVLTPALSLLAVMALAPAAALAQPAAPLYPTRQAADSAGHHYVTDAFHDRLVILDSDLNPVSEIAGLARPLGVAIDATGRIYIGNDGRDNIEVYNTTGTLLLTIDAGGGIPFPNDLALDGAGRLYAADSTSHRVRVYDAASGVWVRDIGAGTLQFPSTVAVNPKTGGASQPPLEIFVGDQKNFKVRVFSETGALVRSFGDKVPGFAQTWQGRFVKLQSLRFDTAGRLHAVDCYMNRVQILDPANGAYMGSYGEYGTGTGQLNLPLGLVICDDAQAALTSAENHAVTHLAYDPFTIVRDWAVLE